MKTLKLLSVLLLLVAFFNSCSNEEIMDDEIELKILSKQKTQSINLNKESNNSFIIKENSLEINNLTSNTNNTYNRGFSNYGPGEPHLAPATANTANTMPIYIEYEIGTTTDEKQAVRSQFTQIIGILSYSTCITNPKAEIWTIDASIYNNNNNNPPIPGQPKLNSIEAHDDISRASESQNYCQ